MIDNFIYLGVNIANTGSEKPRIRRRITIANKVYFSLLPLFRSRDGETKIKVYKTIIRPALCYGSEAWKITKETGRHYRFLKEESQDTLIMWPVQENGSRTLRHNNELYQIHKEIPVSEFVRIHMELHTSSEWMMAEPLKGSYLVCGRRQDRGRDGCGGGEGIGRSRQWTEWIGGGGGGHGPI